MSARFEICRGDDGWWARFRAANGRVVWVTETYKRRASAVNAVQAILFPISDGEYDGQVRDVDERYVAPQVVLESPFFRVETRPLRHEGRRMVEGDPETFWHDHAYHYRQCSGTVDQGGDCTEETPPVGTVVRSRTGTTAYLGEQP